MYVDVHTHLTDKKFHGEVAQVLDRARVAGLTAIVVNGLEPQSNREILHLAATFPLVKPALGIYPVDAVNDLLPADFPFPVARFDVDSEIAFIRDRALAGELAAIGECGLDGHWLGPETYARQEAVFEALIDVAQQADIPLIIHTRKLEERCIAILKAHAVKKVNFHCFGGRVKTAQQCAEVDGWWFSIPANARVNEAFKKMLAVLPMEKILTETDAPYLAPVKGQRNEPANVVATVAFLAELRGISVDAAAQQVYRNFQSLFELKTAARGHKNGA